MENQLEISLLNWHIDRHPNFSGENLANSKSTKQLQYLTKSILTPLEERFGSVQITYGFTGHPLLRYILKNSPGDMAPDIDQHASMELNSKGNRICKRNGAACDFYVEGFEERMDEVAHYICEHLEFDRLYFYGKDRPIHISIGPDNSHYALLRKTRSDGLRVNTKSAKGTATRDLFNDL
ncbi:hypothetical protein CGH71_22290 [Vibrio parahaemolyticus]|uniref:hypothetical protein n=1 Tax=Vibrio parahaemolyticus TaxID=670 RepID=UPI0011226E46|nr:hypothetical protein [Vibrio parahaemolyticus]EGQ7815759.1 hypothetical protein [Vibrio parahaemolyticus]MBE3700951.1 hypothetical protein [Vibrio parahaemolyticus]MBE3780242.1 hypothetical protein [Vibrio parahaemolyticus]MDG2886668.1 hypothetical protein [Vibrio parahaemolyticus]QHG94618.1 hypothetical protein EHC70_10605 [Vibrio parahaemolyticus]